MRAAASIRASFSRSESQIASPTMKAVTNMSPPNITYAISMTRVLLGGVARMAPEPLQVGDHRVELRLALQRLRGGLDYLVGVRVAESAQRAQPRLDVVVRVRGACGEPRIWRHDRRGDDRARIRHVHAVPCVAVLAALAQQIGSRAFRAPEERPVVRELARA